MLPTGWQDGLITELKGLLESDERALALVVFGSWATPELRDHFSDVDTLLVVKDGAQAAFYPSNAWLQAAIDPILGAERSTRPRHGVHRICFADGRRLDVIVVEDSVIANIENWPGHPMRTPRYTVFSRSPACDRAVATVHEAVPPRLLDADQFAELVDGFWFPAQLAIHKAVRGDFLIATHLVHGLARSCLELAMALRDRAAGTHYHRSGAASDGGMVARIDAAQRASTPQGVMDSVEAYSAIFDDLASEYDMAYERKLPAIQRRIEDASSL